MGSASLTNCITSSMDQEEGLLLGSCMASRSEADSGPVVELAAEGSRQQTVSSDRVFQSGFMYHLFLVVASFLTAKGRSSYKSSVALFW